MSRLVKASILNMCMVHDDKGNILVQDRVSEDGFVGITFPGGHVEDGESFVDSVIREVKEETGLDIKNLELCGIKDWINEDKSRYMALLYKTNSFKGELKSSIEGEVKWIKLSEIKNYNLAFDMDKLFRIFIEEKVSELYYYQDTDNDNWIAEVK